MLQERRLNDASLLIGKNYIDAQWVDSGSGSTFNVHGM